MLELRVTVTLTSRKAGNFSTCTKCASFTLSQKCQNGKDLISAHWGIQQLPPSLSPCAPASRASPYSRVPPGVIQTSLVVPSGLPQHEPMHAPFSALTELSWYEIWCPQSKAKDFCYSLLPFCVTLDLFRTKKKGFAGGAGETVRCFQREPGLPEPQRVSSFVAQLYC